MKKVNQAAGFQENISQELLKYLRRQTLPPVLLHPAMQEIQGNMDGVLSLNDLRDDEKAKRYVQLQNRYIAFSIPINPFNLTPELSQAAISQKPDKESFTPPPPSNPVFQTPTPRVETR